jgi:hypothetical protein
MPPGVEGLRPGGIDFAGRREAISLHGLGGAWRWRVVALGEPVEHCFARQPRVIERRPDRARMDLARERVEGAERARLRLTDERIVKRRADQLGLESERGRDLVWRLRRRHERQDGETEIDVIGVIAQRGVDKDEGREVPARRKRGEGSGDAALCGQKGVARRGKVRSARAGDRDRSAREGRRA